VSARVGFFYRRNPDPLTWFFHPLDLPKHSTSGIVLAAEDGAQGSDFAEKTGPEN
jgi:hypothetical protein